MKKLITLFIITTALFFQNASAQIKKGETMLGGSIGFNSNSIKTNYSNGTAKAISFGLAPQLGIGLGKNWILGLTAGYNYSRQKQESGINKAISRNNSYMAGVFARKFHPLGARFGIFGEGGGEYDYTKGTSHTNNDPETGSKGHIWAVYARPGGYVKATNRFIIETTIGSIGYSQIVSKPIDGPDKTTASNFGLGLTSAFSLGFKVVL